MGSRPSMGGAGRSVVAATIPVALGATLAGLVVAYLLKSQCASSPWVDGFQYKRLCYNDIQPLFGGRGIADGLLPYRDAPVEYPVLTGTFMMVTGAILRLITSGGAPSDSTYFLVSAVLLSPFAFAVTLMLRPRVDRSRLLLWACGTPMILYAFHNWDLIAVAGAVGGLMALETRRYGAAGAAFALGASAKLFPAYLVPGAFVSRLADPRRAGAGRFSGGLIVGALVANVPWMLLSWSGWMYVWKFHAVRHPDWGSTWHWIGHHLRTHAPGLWVDSDTYRDRVDVISLVLFAGAIVAFVWRGWQRRTEPLGFPVAATGLGVVAAFLIVSKVHSPQFALWVVPFLVLLNVPWSLVVAYLLADVWEYVSVFWFFTTNPTQTTFWSLSLQTSVFARAAVLAGLMMWAWRAERVVPPAPRVEQPLAHPYASFARPRGTRAMLRRLRRL